MASGSRASSDHATYPDQVHEYLSTPTNPHSLSQAVYARRAEFTRPHSIKIKVGSWNVAACPGVLKDLSGWFVQGRGLDLNLGGLSTSEVAEVSEDGELAESVTEQEARRTKKHPTIPRGEQTTILGGDHIGLYVLGLQEVVELSSTKEYITRVYVDTNPLTKWKKAAEEALPPGYQLVSELQLSGLLLLIYASPAIAPTISSVSSVPIGTGFMGYLGNKGAVSIRIVLGETTRLTFVNCHLASGTEKAHLERRCADVTQILSRTHFDPISRAGVVDEFQESIGDEDFCFWFGDLNFRLQGLPGEDIRRLLMLHTQGEYDVNSKTRNEMSDDIGDEPIIIRHVVSDDDASTAPSTPSRSRSSSELDSASSTALPDPDDFVQDPHEDPGSLQATIDSLLPHDQLRYVQKNKMAFHDGWREGPITFLPTYKYDVGSMGVFDSSEKKRSPSWCDRILFRTRQDRLRYLERAQEEEKARVKDEEMKARGIDHAGDDDEVLFDYDPDTDGDNDNYEYDENYDTAEEPETIITREGYEDKLSLDAYSSHQRVLSSDHKPLTAIFTLEYDAIVPELKSKVHQEVARELDRAENEGRPGITVVVDHSQDSDHAGTSESPNRVMSGDIEGVDFGVIRYLRRKSRGLTIANTGQVPARFAFVDRPTAPGEPDQIAPPWLKVKFVGSEDDDDAESAQSLDRQVSLDPGETIHVNLEVFVQDFWQVRALNTGEIQLEDVIVLSVIEGRDYFVPLKGTWMQSCFGRSIGELIHIPEGGVRALLPPPGEKNGTPVNRGQEVSWSAPRELFKLTEAIESLMTRVLADRDMIDGMTLPRDNSGWPFDSNSWTVTDPKTREEIQSSALEALDTDRNLGAAFPPEILAVEKLEVLCEILLLFLQSLPDGIVSQQLWERLEEDILTRKEHMNPSAERTWVLDILSTSPNHNISFVFLTSMLCKVAAELAPIDNRSSPKSPTSPIKSALDIRLSLSFGVRAPQTQDNPSLVKRQILNRKYAEIFAPVVVRGGGSSLREKDRKALEERKREIVEIFLMDEREGSGS